LICEPVISDLTMAAGLVAVAGLTMAAGFPEAAGPAQMRIRIPLGEEEHG
jgi:hypothetical protein